jgi:hypothetical protein
MKTKTLLQRLKDSARELIRAVAFYTRHRLTRTELMTAFRLDQTVKLRVITGLKFKKHGTLIYYLVVLALGLYMYYIHIDPK